MSWTRRERRPTRAPSFPWGGGGAHPGALPDSPLLQSENLNFKRGVGEQVDPKGDAVTPEGVRQYQAEPLSAGTTQRPFSPDKTGRKGKGAMDGS